MNLTPAQNRLLVSLLAAPLREHELAPRRLKRPTLDVLEHMDLIRFHLHSKPAPCWRLTKEGRRIAKDLQRVASLRQKSLLTKHL